MCLMTSGAYHDTAGIYTASAEIVDKQLLKQHQDFTDIPEQHTTQQGKVHFLFIACYVLLSVIDLGVYPQSDDSMQWGCR